jgi:hypothetical protein
MSALAKAAARWILLVVGVVVLLSTVAAAQGPFRITFNVDRSNPSRTRITGQVINEGRVDVVDVYVTAEAVDARGKVVARGISFVSSSIPQGGTAEFEAAVPAPATATSFRVKVSNFRVGLGSQQAG